MSGGMWGITLGSLKTMKNIVRKHSPLIFLTFWHFLVIWDPLQGVSPLDPYFRLKIDFFGVPNISTYKWGDVGDHFGELKNDVFHHF